jgi:hypothetical protein
MNTKSFFPNKKRLNLVSADCALTALFDGDLGGMYCHYPTDGHAGLRRHLHMHGSLGGELRKEAVN